MKDTWAGWFKDILPEASRYEKDKTKFISSIVTIIWLWFLFLSVPTPCLKRNPNDGNRWNECSFGSLFHIKSQLHQRARGKTGHVGRGWTKGGERQACDSKMKVESDGLSLTFGHTSMTIFPQLAHKPSFQPTFLFKKEKEINFGWKKWFVAWSWALRT